MFQFTHPSTSVPQMQLNMNWTAVFREGAGKKWTEPPQLERRPGSYMKYVFLV